jgi:hypothetical protein
MRFICSIKIWKPRDGLSQWLVSWSGSRFLLCARSEGGSLSQSLLTNCEHSLPLSLLSPLSGQKQSVRPKIQLFKFHCFSNRFFFISACTWGAF